MTKLRAILRERKWRIPPVIMASGVVCITLAVVFSAFKYHYRTTGQKTQNTVLSTIREAGNGEFFRQLDLRDPSQLYAIKDSRPERSKQAEFEIKAVSADQLPQPQIHDYKPLKSGSFPASARAGLTPERAAAAAGTVRHTTAVITPAGRIIHPAALADMKTEAVPESDSMINIYRRGGVSFFRVIKSCGEKTLDSAAGKELLRNNHGEGIYTVVWNHRMETAK